MRNRLKLGLVPLFSVVVSAAFLVFNPANSIADSTRDTNVDEHDYSWNWAVPSHSYLVNTDEGGYMVFEGYDNEDYLVEYYDSSFKFVSSRTVPQELPLFGHFYSDGEYYYILSGQENSTYSDSVICFKLTQYTRSWSIVDTCDICACNTAIPFRAGSADIISAGDYLIVKSCRQMYNGHQANIAFLIDTSSMTLLDSAHQVSYNGPGYCSHSFNQFVRLDGNYVVSVDHGDAYPRAIVISHGNSDITTGKITSTMATQYNTLTFKGSVGDNKTSATLGGFEVSDSSYIAVGSSIDQSGSSSTVKNIFVATVSKDSGSTSVSWLTSYTSGDSVGNPYLVKVDDDRFAVIWNRSGTLYYTFIDGEGDQIGDYYSVKAPVSDCEPIMSGDEVLWYVYDGEVVGFYAIDAYTGEFRSYTPVAMSKVSAASISDQTYTGSSICPSVKLTYDGYELVEGTDFTVSYSNNINAGTATANCTGIGDFTGTLTTTFKINPKTISSAVISPISAQIYTGSDIEPVPEVMLDDLLLVKGTDYAVTYSDNVKSGMATLTVKGIKNYSGTVSTAFKILYSFGWVHEGSDWYYYDNSGNLFKGWRASGGKWYYFGETGAMVTGLQDIGDSRYLFDSDGAMTTGWQKIDGAWYYFDTNGSMASGWRQSGGSWYYLSESGTMVTGWIQSGSAWYYLASGGYMVTGWQQIKGTWYYFESSGAMVTGWKASGGTWYYFNDSGAMVTGWKQIEGEWYYFESSGSMKIGWYYSGGTWYYFMRSGVMATGELEINGVTYIFNTDGECTNP